MKKSVLSLLQCPTCGASLFTTEDQKVCKCRGERTHCFDFSKSGYLNLSGPRGGEGDNKEAVLARRAFLNEGYYQPLSEEIGRILTQHNAQSVLDAGCGEGYYTNRLSAKMDVLGVDLSKNGIDLAAKNAKQLNNGYGFLIASLFTMPIQSNSMDAVLNLFAPCAEEEFLRVLKPGGILILVAAGERHLLGLKKAIYNNPYLNMGRADLPQGMTLVNQTKLAYPVCVQGNRQILSLFSMTPYYWRTSAADRDKLLQIDCLETELDFDIFVFRKDL